MSCRGPVPGTPARGEAGRTLRQMANVLVDDIFPGVHVTTGSLQPFLKKGITNDDRLAVHSVKVALGEFVAAMVIDGHGGEECAAYAQHGIILRELDRCGSICSCTEISGALQRAIKAFDDDLARALKESVTKVPPGDSLSTTFLRDRPLRRLLRCFRGACVVVVLIRPSSRDLWVANLGDCLVVEGHENVEDPSGSWIVRRLTEEHNTSNKDEVKRIQDEHPGEECILDDLVIGRIRPTRTVGNWDQKWPADMVAPLYPFLPFVGDGKPRGRTRLLNISLTPPYQSSVADVRHEKLPSGRGVLIVASDGLPDNCARLTLDPHPDVERRNQEMIESWVRSANRKPLEGLEDVEVTAVERIMRDVLGGTEERKVMINLTDWFHVNIWDDMTVVAIELFLPE
ncbi:protein serine/threonine phosphatase 2C [Dacryopinax primogenitus]|uniref:Protein serine/threonine phosphatase 2C n=1 Tax=Dacryopinax primogenitus (strain DJM 731) TaxID=1858805 RepID=M5G3E4_DACPD|nr:protein serine/threonine phosphatase 2C [Dacryopinax primogenitus]EJU04736.1 protein serine/threonine phosphatase 2C [Dacryopinax primogenitus]